MLDKRDILLYHWNHYDLYKYLCQTDILNFKIWNEKKNFHKWYIEKILNIEVNY